MNYRWWPSSKFEQDTSSAIKGYSKFREFVDSLNKWFDTEYRKFGEKIEAPYRVYKSNDKNIEGTMAWKYNELNQIWFEKFFDYFRKLDRNFELDSSKGLPEACPVYPGNIPSVLKHISVTIDVENSDIYPGIPRKHHPGDCKDTFYDYVFSLETLGLARYVNLDFIPADYRWHWGNEEFPWGLGCTVREGHIHQIDCNCGYDMNTFNGGSMLQFIVTKEGKSIPDPDYDYYKQDITYALHNSPFSVCTAGYSYHYDQSEQGFTLYSSYIDVALAQGRPDKAEDIDAGVPYNWYQHVSENHANLGREPSRFIMNRRPCGSLLTSSANNHYESRNEQGFKVWSYGDSKVLFGPMPDCNSDCDDCNQPNFVIGWVNTGNLKLVDHTIPDPMKFRCLACDPDPKKLVYKHSPYCQFYIEDYAFLDSYHEMTDRIDDTYYGFYQGLCRRTIDKGINYGLEIDHLLRIQGNPTVIIPYVDSDDTDLDSIDNHGGAAWYYGGGEIKSSDAQSVTFEKSLSTIFISPSRKISIGYELSENYPDPKLKSECDAIFEQITNTGAVPTKYFPHRVCGWKNMGDLNLAPEKDISVAKKIIARDESANFLIKEKIKASLDKFENSNKYLNTNNTIGSNNRYQNFLRETQDYGNKEKGEAFEKFCKTLLEAMGYEVEHTGQTNDGGIDLIAEKSDGFTHIKTVVQCKHYHDGNAVGPDILRQLAGTLKFERANIGMIMTTGTFTRAAKNFAENNNNELQIKDSSDLESMTREYLK